jgi:SAM-dependent methyltransferase
MSQIARYDQIGAGYSLTRREDPRISLAIRNALGEARSVVNVGAGTGSYEPDDRYVIAVEPSDVMASQRPRTIPPALRASAAELPLRDHSVDAAMALLTIHHWDDELERGIKEMRRVARDTVVISPTIRWSAATCGSWPTTSPRSPSWTVASSQRLSCSSVGWAGGHTSRWCLFPAIQPIGCSAHSGHIRNECSTNMRETRPRDSHGRIPR